MIETRRARSRFTFTAAIAAMMAISIVGLTGCNAKKTPISTSDSEQKEWSATFTVTRQIAAAKAELAIDDPAFDFEKFKQDARQSIAGIHSSISFTDLGDAKFQVKLKAGVGKGSELWIQLKTQMMEAASIQTVELRAGPIAISQMQRSIASTLAVKRELKKQAAELAKQFAKTRDESFRSELVAVNKRIEQLMAQAGLQAEALTKAASSGKAECLFQIRWAED